MTDSALELHEVTKRYAGHVAVHELSLEVPSGSIYGLLGPNGAGKTTTIRMIMGIVKPDTGTAIVLGVKDGGWALSHRIGYLPEERGLYKKMKVLDLLIFLAEAKGVDRRVAKTAAPEWLERLGLSAWGGHKVDQLSKGMQQKVQFIATVLHKPDLVILDEPFAGLDPVNSQVMKDTVLELSRQGATIVFSTHVMDQAERLCESVCIIARGEKVLDGRVADVKRDHHGRHVAVGVQEGLASIDKILADKSLVAKADNYGNFAEVEMAEGTPPQKLLTSLLSAGAQINRFEIVEPSLHKIFLDRVGSSAATAVAVEP
ncbi:MAG: ATP-binding cassette domain-containing protein [Gemmatimonadetes bacterium]|nr:ATP-binding cassette domain-containing protein [Gemmatimonadota bacterium]